MSNSVIWFFGIFIIFISICGAVIYLTPIKKYFTLKNLPSINRLKKSIGLSIEDGKGIHLSIGKSNLNNFHGAASLIGLETMDKILDQSLLSDNPPITTSGSGDIALLAQTKLSNFLNEKTSISHSTSSTAFLTGPTNMSYIAGAIPTSSRDELATQIFVGNFGPEIGLLLHAGNQKNHFSLSATDDLEGQAVSYVCSDESLLGDQIFSIPTRLGLDKNQTHQLIFHDFLRWLVVFLILFLVLLKIIGIV
jgi:hypothetical protein